MSEQRLLGAALPNHDFSAPAAAVGVPPANHDFATAPETTTTSFPNADFESGDLSGWEVVGNPSLVPDATGGSAALLAESDDRVVTPALEISSFYTDAVIEVGYRQPGRSWLVVHVLSGPDFDTRKLLHSSVCTDCGNWQDEVIDLSAYEGQSVKLSFEAYVGYDVSVDNFRLEVSPELAGWARHGPAYWAPDRDGALELRPNGIAVSEPIRIEHGAEHIELLARTPTARGLFSITVLHGEGYAERRRVHLGSVPDGENWAPVQLDVTEFAGEEVRLELQGWYGSVQVDDVGGQVDTVPEWEITDVPEYTDDGAGGTSLRLTGRALSAPFVVADDAQQLLIRLSGQSQHWAVVWTGPALDVEHVLGPIPGGADWNDVPIPIGAFAGQTIRLELRPNAGPRRPIELGWVGEMQSILPGWEIAGSGAVAGRNNVAGAYVSSAGLTEFTTDEIQVHPSRLFRYAWDAAADFGATVRVWWYNDSGDSWVVDAQASNEAVPLTTTSFYLHDFMGDRGRFVIHVYERTRLYEFGGNVGSFMASEPFSARVGRGIDTTSGVFSTSEQDLHIEGANPFGFTRYYTSTSHVPGEMGFGWSHNYATRILRSGSDRIVEFGSGRAEAFDYRFIGGDVLYGYEPFDPRVTSSLVEHEDGTYTYSTKDRSVFRFSSSGSLLDIVESNGRTLSLSHDIDGDLVAVTDDAGRALTISRDAEGRIDAVTDPVGATSVYTYEGNRLTSAASPEGVVRSYTYADDLLTAIVDGEGNSDVVNSYDDFGRLVTQRDAVDASIEIRYDTPGVGATEVVDPNGGVSQFYFNDGFRTTDAIDAQGSHRRYIYDGDGNLSKIIEPAGDDWAFTYDPNFDLTALVDPLGNPINITYNPEHLPTLISNALGHQTALEYDERGNLTKVVDALGHETVYTYDDNNNQTSVVDALGHVTAYTHDDAGNVLSITDAVGQVTTFTYDAAGRVTSETDPVGGTTTWLRDFDGRVIGRIDPDGHGVAYQWLPTGQLYSMSDRLERETFWHYDARGLLAKKIHPDGTEITYTYDANREMVSTTDPLGRTTSYEHDEAGHLTKKTLPSGASYHYAYDTSGRLLSETDPIGRTTSYAYDDGGRLAATTFPDGTSTSLGYDAIGQLVSSTNELGHTTKLAYDAVGNIISTTDPLGRTTTHTYDASGRRLTTTNPAGETTTQAHDAVGRVVRATDATGHQTSYNHNGLGLISNSTDAAGNTTYFTYDELGRLLLRADPAGNVWTTSYDAAGQIVASTDPNGSTWSTTYDLMGRVASRSDPLGNGVTNIYDAAGQLVGQRDALGRTTSFHYDVDGLRVREVDPAGGSIRLGHDAAGQRTSLTDPNGETRHYEYDSRGRLATTIDPLGRRTTITYDAAGRPIGQVNDRNLAVVRSYDDAGQLASMSLPGEVVRYAYDLAGRRSAIVDTRGITRYGYDAAGRVTSIESPEGIVGYSYDSVGRRSSMTTPSSAISYEYQPTGEIAAIVDGAGRRTTFDYDPGGQLLEVQRPNGVDTVYDRDRVGRVIELTHLGDGPIETFEYVYDAVGNPTQATDSGGTTTIAVDRVDRITSVVAADGSETTYTYDPAGNRTSRTVDGLTTSYRYDAAGQLSAVDDQAYRHDEAGNLIDDGQAVYGWDALNRLTRITTGDQTVSYTYDPGGLLVGEAVDAPSAAEASTFLYDRAEDLPTIVESTRGAYQHGPGGVIGQQVDGSTSYLLGDRSSNVTHVTDEAGSVSGTADYSTFGERIATGESSLFGFTGEPHLASGVYLRARHYDPVSGRFGTADTVQPNAGGTQGFNLYAYAANNPMRWTDPSGHRANPVGPTNPEIIVTAYETLTQRSAATRGRAALGLLQRLFHFVRHPAVVAAIAVAIIVVFLLLILIFMLCAEYDCSPDTRYETEALRPTQVTEPETTTNPHEIPEDDEEEPQPQQTERESERCEDRSTPALTGKADAIHAVHRTRTWWNRVQTVAVARFQSFDGSCIEFSGAQRNLSGVQQSVAAALGTIPVIERATRRGQPTRHAEQKVLEDQTVNLGLRPLAIAVEPNPFCTRPREGATECSIWLPTTGAIIQSPKTAHW